MTDAAKRRETFNSSLQQAIQAPMHAAGEFLPGIVICESELQMIRISMDQMMRVINASSDGALFIAGEREMKDMQAHLEKLRVDAAECARIRDLADSESKRELFGRLAEHLTALAAEVERAMNAARPNGDTR